MNHANRQHFYNELELPQERKASNVEYSPGCRNCDPGSRPWREPYSRTGSPWSGIVTNRKQKEKRSEPGLPEKAALFGGPKEKKEKKCDPIS